MEYFIAAEKKQSNKYHNMYITPHITNIYSEKYHQVRYYYIYTISSLIKLYINETFHL